MKSIFKNKQGEIEYYESYDETLQLFEVPSTSNTIQTSFGETHYLSFGDPSKPPVVLLHGMTMSSTMWYPNVKQLIQERYVYAVDIIGDFGKSKPKAAIKNKEAAAKWVLEVIDGLQLQSTDLVGHSIGGFLALNFSLLYPERVSKLVLLAPAGSFYRMNPVFFIKVYPALLFHTENLIDNLFKWSSANNEPLPSILRNQVILGFQYAKPQLQVMPTVFSKEELRNYKNSTLLLIGENEVIYPAAKAVTYAKKCMINLEAHIIPRANHSFTLEHALIVNEYILQFLRESS
ncbi:MAG: alpha/beta hydrolase [Lysinibacillus sp.]